MTKSIQLFEIVSSSNSNFQKKTFTPIYNKRYHEENSLENSKLLRDVENEETRSRISLNIQNLDSNSKMEQTIKFKDLKKVNGRPKSKNIIRKKIVLDTMRVCLKEKNDHEIMNKGSDEKLNISIGVSVNTEIRNPTQNISYMNGFKESRNILPMKVFEIDNQK